MKNTLELSKEPPMTWSRLQSMLPVSWSREYWHFWTSYLQKLAYKLPHAWWKRRLLQGKQALSYTTINFV